MRAKPDAPADLVAPGDSVSSCAGYAAESGVVFESLLASAGVRDTARPHSQLAHIVGPIGLLATLRQI
jgi:hypothetical protein